MKAKGNPKIILQKVGEVQDLVGQAKGYFQDDQISFITITKN
jgi:hypothetical protein